jgi:endoglucanase
MRARGKCSSSAATLALAWLLAGCIGVSAPKKPGAGGAKTVASTTKLAKCTKTKAAEDAPIDDFEDNNTQVMRVGGRDGYWWKSVDPKGSKFEPDELKLAEPGAGNSLLALHATGRTVTGDGAYGALFGTNFSSNSGEAALYDASTYAGIYFKAKGDPGKATSVRFKIGDVNTHPDLGVCSNCWNHFGKNLTLTPEWTEHKILFADLKQADGWGSPRPPAVVAEKLYSMDFSFEGGGEFGIWLDDVAFLICDE